MKKHARRVVPGALLVVAALLLVAGPVGAAPKAPTTTVTIWTDADRKAAVDKIAVHLGQPARRATSTVVQKDFGKIRDDLKTVQPETRPRRDRRRARLDGRARGQRPRPAAQPACAP